MVTSAVRLLPCGERVSHARAPQRRRPSASLVSWSDVGSHSLYRACLANSPPPTPLITRRCSHRPPARQSFAGAHSSPPAHPCPRTLSPRAPPRTRARSDARRSRVLPRAIASAATHPSPAFPAGHAPPCPLRRIRAIAPVAPRAPVWRQPPRGSAPTPSSVAIRSYPPSPIVSSNDSPRCHYLDHPWPIMWHACVSRACQSSSASTRSCHRGGRGAPGHATTRAASAGAPSLSIGPRPWQLLPAPRPPAPPPVRPNPPRPAPGPPGGLAPTLPPEQPPPLCR